MKNLNSFLFISSLVAIISIPVKGQTFVHNTVGLNSTFSGDCTQNTCSGTYVDDGGTFFNYSTNVNGIYHSFCPNTPGTCISANFSSIDLENGWDFLDILNGPTQGSTLLASITGFAAGSIQSTDASGCLSFRFFSDGSFTRPGWAATFSCVPCTQRATDGLTDCTNAQQICSNSSLSGTAPGPGSNEEGCAGCGNAEGEKFTNWYFFETTSAGVLEFDLTANNGTDDLDFVLYGPGVDCGSLGTPIRCSYAGNGGATGGMSNLYTGTSEGVFGDGWTSGLNVNAGDVFVLMINNWSPGGGAYTLNWTGTTSLECNPISLPVEFLSFEGKDKPGYNLLKWSTGSELNNNYFTIERSRDGGVWESIGNIDSYGTSNGKQTYTFEDRNIEKGTLYYYRLKQTDYNGSSDMHEEIVAIFNNYEKPHVVKIVNLLGQEVGEDFEGIRIEIYSDGSRVKKMGGE
tara:strand:+ start:93095 stop:94471 length:1377 start_codon:yes stop_codon:yes gene_type:complete